MFPASCSARAKNCSKGCHDTVRVASMGCGLLLLIPAAEWHCLYRAGAIQQRSANSLHLHRTNCAAVAACSHAQVWHSPVLMYNRRSGASGFTLPCNSTKSRSQSPITTDCSKARPCSENIHLQEVTERRCLSGLLSASNGPEHALCCALSIALKNVSVREDPAQSMSCSARLPCLWSCAARCLPFAGSHGLLQGDTSTVVGEGKDSCLVWRHASRADRL